MLTNGINVTAKTDFQQQSVARFNDIQLCKTFGRTQRDIQDMTVDFYQDVITILNMERAREKAEHEKAQKKASFRKSR